MMQPYDFYVMLDARRHEKDEDRLFWGHLLISVTNYCLKEENRYKSAGDFVGAFISEGTKEHLKDTREKAKKELEEKIRQACPHVKFK